jgi:hypothetical protein
VRSFRSVAELPSLVDEIDAGTVAVKANTLPLAAVERIWAQPGIHVLLTTG